MAKRDPFDDDDLNDSAANKAAAESFKEKLQEKREAAAGEVELEVDVDRAEDELTDLPERQQETRKQKRQNRYREMQEERDAAQREREEMKTRLSQMEQMLHQRQAPQAPEPDKPSPSKERLTKAFRDQELLYQNYSARQAQMTPEEVAEFKQRAYDIQAEIVEAGAEIAMEKRGIRKVDEAAVRGQIVQEQLMREHGDVLGNPAMRDFCQGAWLQLRAKGRPDDWSTIAEAAERTRKEFSLPLKNARAPSESYKRKLTGVPRGAGAGSEGGSQVVTMTAHDKSMANALYKHIPSEKERYQRWAAGPGKRAQDKRQAG